MIREVLAPVMSIWRAYALGCLHAVVYVSLTAGLFAWLFEAL